MSNATPYISVIVPVYNGSQFLHRCLDAISASSYRSFEVIVVDDCSTDNSAEIAAMKGAGVVFTKRNSGPAAARNLAAETAAGEILLFVDADVVVKPDTLARVATRLSEQPEFSAVFGSYDDQPAEQNFLSQYKNLQHHFVHHNSNSEAGTFWSGLGAIRRTVFLDLGGFDCKLFRIPSIEDIELGMRLRSSGGRILLDREIQATHLKKWDLVSHLRTEILCRALPWSKLILERRGMINDMNLKTSDRISAGLVALSICVLPFVFWKPSLVTVIALLLCITAFLNREILLFYARKKGLAFAALTFPWQLLYFFYSGAVFFYCWVRYGLPQMLGFRKEASAAN